MKKTTILLIELLAVFGLLVGLAFAAPLPINSPAPPFTITSGDNQTISSDQFKGKSMLILYESKDLVELNRPLKNKLNALFAALSPKQKAQIVILPVVNCSGAGMFAWVWKNNLIDATKREKLTIYGDWDGQMAIDYGMARDSNVVAVNRQGIIKYFHSGQVGPEEAPTIIKLLSF
ncbi:MAG: hypothetical protein WC901_07730 [Candidatus Margulisiibacteriota bacterium]